MVCCVKKFIHCFTISIASSFDIMLSCHDVMDLTLPISVYRYATITIFFSIYIGQRIYHYSPTSFLDLKWRHDVTLWLLRYFWTYPSNSSDLWVNFMIWAHQLFNEIQINNVRIANVYHFDITSSRHTLDNTVCWI